jgi:hypothetical protein
MVERILALLDLTQTMIPEDLADNELDGVLNAKTSLIKEL